MGSLTAFKQTNQDIEYVVVGITPWSNSGYTMLDLRANAWDNKNQTLVVVEKDKTGDLKSGDRLTAHWNYIGMIAVPNMTSKLPLLQSFEILGEDYAMKFGVGVTNGL